MEEFSLKGDNGKYTEVILYGGGRIGKNMIIFLKQQDIKIRFIWDENAKNIKIEGNDSIICEPDYQYENKEIPIILAIYSEKVCNEIENKLKKNGFLHIFRGNETKELCLFHRTLKYNLKECRRCLLASKGCEEFRKYLLKKEQNLEADKKLYIKQLSITTTMRCSLYCQNCVNCIPEFQERGEYLECSIEDWMLYINKILQAAGYIEQLGFTGGEFIMYSGWKELLKQCLTLQGIGMISIITNGIMPIQEQEFRNLSNDKIFILLDNYGERLNQKQRERIQYVKGLFIKYNINYMELENENGTWYDYGNFQKKNQKKDMLIQKYHRCVRNECLVLTSDGRLSFCGRQNIGLKLGKVTLEQVKEDIIEVKDRTSKELKREIEKLSKQKFLQICDFCNGGEKTVLAGIQADNKNINKF